MNIPYNYVFTFGKYKGRKISDIIEEDWEYIKWCKRNVKDFKLNSEATKAYTNSKRWRSGNSETSEGYYQDQFQEAEERGYFQEH